MAKESAEEKLLKMMQKSGAPVPASASVKTSSAIKSSAKPKLNFAFSIGMLNQILFLGAIVCIAGLAYEMNNGMNLLNQDIDLTSDIKAPVRVADIALPTAKDIDFYLTKFSSRNIFRPYEAQVESLSPGKITLGKRLSKYKLVGVAWLDLPESATVMIEDTEQKTTIFLKQGQQLEDITVKTIFTDRVVFSYQNEETTIKL